MDLPEPDSPLTIIKFILFIYYLLLSCCQNGTGVITCFIEYMIFCYRFDHLGKICRMSYWYLQVGNVHTQNIGASGIRL